MNVQVIDSSRIDLHRKKEPTNNGMSLVLFLELNPPGSLVGIKNEMGRPFGRSLMQNIENVKCDDRPRFNLTK